MTSVGPCRGGIAEGIEGLNHDDDAERLAELPRVLPHVITRRLRRAAHLEAVRSVADKFGRDGESIGGLRHTAALGGGSSRTSTRSR